MELEKFVALLVITGHGEQLLGILLHHSGLLADVDAVQELSDVLLSDRGGLLDQGRWKTEKPGEGRDQNTCNHRWNVTKYIYSRTIFDFSISILCYFIPLRHYIIPNVIITPLFNMKGDIVGEEHCSIHVV